jgi:ABC-type nitrate/sulfonate/bicarbonate transport system substrate-binding protein
MEDDMTRMIALHRATMVVAALCLSVAQARSESAGQFSYGRFMAPVLVPAGQQFGHFDKTGVTFVDQESGATALPLIANGSLAGIIDISEPPLITAHARGIPMKVVWLTSIGIGELVAKTSVAAVKDLSGKTIGVPVGTVAQFQLEKVLSEAGVDVKSVTLADLAPPAIPAAFASGAIDAAYVWPPFSSQIASSGGTTLDRRQIGVGYAVFSDNFIAARPDAVQDFVCALKHTQDAYFEDPAKAHAAIGQAIGMPADAVGALLPPNLVVKSSDMLTAKGLGDGSTRPDFVAGIAGVAAWLKAIGRLDVSLTDAEAVELVEPKFAKAAADGACR